MKKPINRQSGFAIGTILLAVVLIAAIVSAIAIASRGTQSQGGREQARVNATTLVQQGINLKQGFDRMIATTLNDAVNRNTISLTVDANGINAGTAVCNTNNAAGRANSVCLYDNPNGGAAEQNPPANAFAAGGPTDARYKLRHNVTLFNLGTGAGHSVIYAGNVSLPVCRQINALSNGLAVNANPPFRTPALFTIDNSAAGGEIGATGNATIAAAAGDAMQGWTEGCFLSAAAAPANEAGYVAAAPYIYFRVVFTN